MTNLTAIPGLTPIPELETTTLALGGPGGPMNSQAQALLNNIAYILANYSLESMVSLLNFYEIAGGCTGRPAANSVLLTFRFTRDVNFPTNMSGSTGYSNTNATGTSVFTLNKNGSSLGEMTFPPSTSTPTFLTSSTSFTSGDILTVVSPSVQDATLADIGFTLVGGL